MSQQADNPEQGLAEADLLTYARVFLSHWWVIVPLAVLGAVVGMVYSGFIPKMYRASCRVEIFENLMLQISDNPDFRQRPWDYNPTERHILLLKSSNLNQQVTKRLSRTWPDSVSGVNLSVGPTAEESNEAIVDISVDSQSPQYSYEYLQELLTAYNQMRIKESERIHEETIRNLEREKAKRARELAAAQQAVARFEAENRVAYEQQRRESDRAHLNNLLQKHREIQTQRTMLDEQLKLLKNADPTVLGDVLEMSMYSSSDRYYSSRSTVWSNDPRWRESVAEVEQLELELEEMAEVFKPAHPKVIDAKRRLSRAKHRLQSYAELARERLKSRQEALQLQERTLATAAEEIREDVEASSLEAARYDKLKAHAEHLKELYDRVEARIIDSSTNNPDRFFSRVIDGPYKVDTPISPNRTRLTMLGFMAGGGLGCLLVLLLYLRQVRLYNFRSIESQQNVPCLADIPQIASEEINGRPLFINDLSKSSPICEVYRSLRTVIDQKLSREHKVLLMTSPNPGDGKTFTCLNLANVYAWHRQKVLLVDGDFRRATLRQAFPDAPIRGLIDCLSDLSLEWQDCVMTGVAKNLDYLPAGKTGEQAAELISSPRFADVLKQMRQHYDMIVFDSAPVNKVVDTILLGEQLDAAIIVARPGNSAPDAIRHALGRLAAAKVMGFVLNGLTPTSRKYANYIPGSAGYHAAYGYSQSYYNEDVYK